MTRLETSRLVIRSFTPDDWQGVQKLAVDKETHRGDPHDPPWPTSDEECKGFAEYLANQREQYFAVCRKDNETLIGLLAFNGIDEKGRLDLGYQIHSKYQDNDHDREALERIVGYAFENREISSIETRTNSEWIEQLAPLKSLGFTSIGDDPGNLGIGESDWRKRGGSP